MAIRVSGTKTVPVTGDTLIIKDGQEADPSLELKEIDFADLGVSAVVLTSTVEATSTDTYTMYSDVLLTKAIGTFDIVNGADGTGSSLPNYDNTVTYITGQQVMTNSGLIYISLQDPNTGNVPPLLGSGFWARSPATLYPTWSATNWPTMSVVYLNRDLWIAPTGADVANFVVGSQDDEWRRYVPGQIPWRGDTGYIQGATVWLNGKQYEANAIINPTFTFNEGFDGATWRELVEIGPLTFMSLAPGNINVNVHHAFSTGTRVQYAFETNSVAASQIRVDPFGMIRRHPLSARDDEIEILSSGYYKIDMGYNAQPVTTLQESILYVNSSLRNRAADGYGTHGVIPWQDPRRILHFDQPADASSGTTRKPNSGSVIRHFIKGDYITFEEDGASSNTCHNLRLTIQQIDQRAAP